MTQPMDATPTTTPTPATAFRGLMFSNRTVLYVHEVARRLEVCEQQVVNWIESGRLAAVDVGNGQRHSWRIPVAEYERFIQARSSLTVRIGKN